MIEELKYYGKSTKNGGGGGGLGRGVVGLVWGVRVDVNEELKFFVKIQKKKVFLGGGGWGGSGWM